MDSISVDNLNTQLVNLYGIDTVTTDAMYRVVWSEDQHENRMVEKTDSGVLLLHPVRQYVRKYQHVKDKWILENLVVIPERNRAELCGLKVGYEPLYVFETEQGEQIFPSLEACQFVINLVMTAKGQKFDGAKYKEDPEKASKELNEMQEKLFGNETDVTNALAHREGVIVPSNYSKDVH